LNLKLNDVEWYVYGSASDGRVATVYPRYKIRDNETFDDNFEDSPPSLEVAYNTEMVSNTFTSYAVSASITGIETHRHLGEKRYEIKDHLGNVRAVTSDIKNASNYSAVVSSWKFLADLKSISNYHPYGSLIDEGSWSGSCYNYGYNGMLKEGIGKDISHTHFRNLSSGDFVGWWSPDPLEYKFPSYSPYATMGNNPIRFTDRRGDSAFVYGDSQDEFIEDMNHSSNMLKFGLDETNGQMIIKERMIGPLSQDDSKVVEAIEDCQNNVNIFADSRVWKGISADGTEGNIVIGMFGGSYKSHDGTNEAMQYMDFTQVEKAINSGLIKKGDASKHEFIEAYLGVTQFPNDYLPAHYETLSIFKSSEIETNSIFKVTNGSEIITIIGSDLNFKNKTVLREIPLNVMSPSWGKDNGNELIINTMRKKK
jgi:hypothetical protein